MTAAGKGGGASKGPSPARAPAFDDAAITAARQYARSVWNAESARVRDRLLALPLVERLVALDDEEVRAALTPEHRVELRVSIAKAADSSQIQPPAPPPEAEEFAREQAAWRVRDAASQAEMRRIDRLQRWVPWALVPAATLAPAAVAAAVYGWGPLRLASVLPSLPSLPLAATGSMCVALLGAGLCAVVAAHARRAAWAWGAAGAAFLAGVLLLISARTLPVHIAGNGVATPAGQSLTGAVLMAQPTAIGARLEVLSGNGVFRRGELLDYSGRDPAQFFRGGW